jgi:hypothetical protein
VVRHHDVLPSDLRLNDRRTSVKSPRGLAPEWSVRYDMRGWGRNLSDLIGKMLI